VVERLRTISGHAWGVKQPDERSYLMTVSMKWEGTPLRGADERERFEQAFLPHLDAAYNLARWLTRDDHDAEDLVQAAFLRALKFFGGFHGANSRAWPPIFAGAQLAYFAPNCPRSTAWFSRF
jgi:hypothetical protein